MGLENDTNQRIWPASGVCGASYRVMFPLAAIWALVSLALWQWGGWLLAGVADPYLWHLHEMTFGFGGAALVGYLLSACSSWTGRAPVAGWPVAGIALLWIAARLAMLSGGVLPLPAVAGLNIAVFWGLAGILIHEARRGAKRKIWAYIGFVITAGLASGLVIFGVAPGPILAPVVFAVLLIVVGGRMTFGFLQSDAQRRGLPGGRDMPGLGLLGAVVLLLSLMFLSVAREQIGGLMLTIAATSQVVRLWYWPLRQIQSNTLLAMLLIGFFWLPVGMLLWAADLWGVPYLTQVSTLHGAMMGPLASLIMAVMARPVAQRGGIGLTAAKASLPAFLTLQTAILLRLFEWQTLSAIAWCIAWGLFLVVLLSALSRPIPRPIFSGSRQSHGH